MASSVARESVNLLEYKDNIKRIVKEVAPKAKIKVYEDYYLLDETSVTKGERIRALVSQYPPTKRIGGKICVERDKVENILIDEDRV